MWRSELLSLTLHIAGVALLICAATSPQAEYTLKQAAAAVTPLIAPYIPRASVERGGGGGGGGDRSLLPPNRGRLPRFAPRQFTPPMAVVSNPQPRLVLEPTLVIEPDARVASVSLPVFGDPRGVPGPPSNGSGSGSGIGTGTGNGVGSGAGPGYGPGKGGGIGGGTRGLRGGITQAVLLWSCDPDYSDDARKAKVQGTVVLLIDIDGSGKVAGVRLQQTLGLGLDEKAIEAVRKWRFRPAYQDGRPVLSSALVEMRFRLL